MMVRAAAAAPPGTIRPLACAVDQLHCTGAHPHLGAINHVGVLQGDGEGQLQLVGKGVEGRQGSAGEKHASHSERLQGTHADAAGEAPVAQRGVGHATLQSQGSAFSTQNMVSGSCWGSTSSSSWVGTRRTAARMSPSLARSCSIGNTAQDAGWGSAGAALLSAHYGEGHADV